jgi:hypothetical protein
LAEVYLAQRRYSDAEPLLKEALQIQERALGPAHPEVAKLLMDYSLLLRKQHRQREAKSMEKRAKNIVKAFRTEKQDLGTVDVSSLKRHR